MSLFSINLQREQINIGHRQLEKFQPALQNVIHSWKDFVLSTAQIRVQPNKSQEQAGIFSYFRWNRVSLKWRHENKWKTS